MQMALTNAVSSGKSGKVGQRTWESYLLPEQPELDDDDAYVEELHPAQVDSDTTVRADTPAITKTANGAGTSQNPISSGNVPAGNTNPRRGIDFMDETQPLTLKDELLNRLAMKRDNIRKLRARFNAATRKQTQCSKLLEAARVEANEARFACNDEELEIENLLTRLEPLKQTRHNDEDLDLSNPSGKGLNPRAELFLPSPPLRPLPLKRSIYATDRIPGLAPPIQTPAWDLDGPYGDPRYDGFGDSYRAWNDIPSMQPRRRHRVDDYGDFDDFSSRRVRFRTI